MNTKRHYMLILLRHRLLFFLVLSLLLILSHPFVETHYPLFSAELEIAFLLLIMLMQYMVTRNKNVFAITQSILALTAFAFCAASMLESHNLQITGLLLLIVYLSLSTLSLIAYVLEYNRITEDKIYGAMAAYLMLGITWTAIFITLEMTSSNAFNFVNAIELPQHAVVTYRTYLDQFLYFSFVNLSTLGYGDILPLSSSARLFSALEAVTGQLYLTVLIARLVGLHLLHTHNKP